MTKKRAIGVWALIVVAALLLFTTTASVWVKRQALNTDNWVAAADKVLAEPAIQAALSTYIVDQLYANVDVQEFFAEKLPTDLSGLAGPLSAALREPATVAVEKLIATPRFQKLWSNANRLAHEKLVAILEDKGNYVSTTGGTVTLELGKLVTALGEDLGLPSALLDKIPADAGNIVLAQSDQLKGAQTAVKALRWMSILLGLIVIGLYGLAVYLAKDARRRTLRNVGWSVLVVGLFVAVTRRLTGNYVLSMLSDPSLTPAVKAAYAIGSQLLATLAWSIVTWGLVLIVGCIVAGPSRVAVWFRRTIAPVLNLRWEAVAAVAAGIYVLLLLWAPFAALQTWLSALGLAVVLGLGIWALRTRTLAEFPDAELGGTLGGARTKLAAAWGSVSSSVKGIGGGSDGGAGDDHAGQLERLAQLHDSGKLDDAEFASAKAKLLA
jgi:hypothetical protein